MKRVLAIFLSDLHISHSAPVARAEQDWYKAQKSILQQLQALKEKTNAPIIYAGDLTDKWNLPPEAINFMLAYLPSGYGIPGNHDLPNHSLSEIKRSAYWTLVEAGKVFNIESTIEIGQLRLHGFPYGKPIYPLRNPHSLAYEVAIVHAYIWKKGYNFIGATKETLLVSYKENLRGYSHAFFGDNHIHFEHEFDHGCKVWNCGLSQRRRSDEKKLRPSVGLLHEDGTISRHFLDCKDEWNDIQEVADHFDASGLVKELEGLSDAGIDFEETLKRAVCNNSIGKETKVEVLEALR